MKKNDFVKWNDREDVSPFLSVFLYFSAIPSVSVPVCVLLASTVQSALWAQTQHCLDFCSPSIQESLGLNAEAKKKKKKRQEYLPTVHFILLFAQTTLPNQYLWSIRTKISSLQAECVCSDRFGRMGGWRQGREPACLFFFFFFKCFCACCAEAK